MTTKDKKDKHDRARREFVRKAAYVAPAILSLSAVSSVAKAGSGSTETCDPPPPKLPKTKPKK